MHLIQQEPQSNLARCEDILECRRQIHHWKSRLEELETEQERRAKLARLGLDARTTWRSLSTKEKTEKEFILAALQSAELPDLLEDFPNSAFLPHIRLDRDILLARVARSDFAIRHVDDRVFIPPKLRGDKEVILSVLPKHPQILEVMSAQLRDDPEILESLLQNPTLPNHFLQHFSERIRGDPELMFQVLQHPGLSAWVYVSQSLRDDKDFILKILQNSEKAHHGGTQLLKHVSHRLRADHDVVYAAVQKSGLNLRHAAYSLRGDSTVVLAACAENGSAFKYCLPGSLKDDLGRDREFVLNVLKTAPTSVLGNFTEIFKNDRQVLLQALRSGLEWSEIPSELKEDKVFILEALARNSQLYLELSKELRDTEEIALQALQADDANDEVILEATERVSKLLANHDAMIAIAKNYNCDVMQETLQFSPLEIRGDKGVMIEAVKNNSIAFEYCSEELQEDCDVVMAAIEASSTSLYLVSDSFQLANPQVVITAIQRTAPGDLWSAYDDVDNELWANRDVAMAWLSRGGDWLDDDFPEAMCDDEGLFLMVAEHNWTEFDYASEKLKSNKEFMLKAAAKDGRVYKEVSDDLRHDFDLALVAFGNSRVAIQFFTGPEDFEFMVYFAKRVNERLATHSAFMKQVLCSMARPAEENQECYLPMLSQGPETSSMYKQLISSYLGIPQSRELRLLRGASQNLLQWGY
jgi:hypothetical protein